MPIVLVSMPDKKGKKKPAKSGSGKKKQSGKRAKGKSGGSKRIPKDYLEDKKQSGGNPLFIAKLAAKALRPFSRLDELTSKSESFGKSTPGKVANFLIQAGKNLGLGKSDLINS